VQLGSSCQLERSDRLEKAISESVDKLGTKWHSFSAEADGVNDLDLLQHGIDFLVAETNTDEFKSILLESSCNHQSTSGKTVAYIIKSLGFKVQTKFPEDFDYRQAALDMVAVFATWTWESAEDATKCLSYCSLSLCSPPFFSYKQTVLDTCLVCAIYAYCSTAFLYIVATACCCAAGH